MKAMYLGQEVEVIDCTPTWLAVLPIYLESYFYLRSIEYPNQEQRDSLKGVELELQRMAAQADKKGGKS